MARQKTVRSTVRMNSKGWSTNLIATRCKMCTSRSTYLEPYCRECARKLGIQTKKVANMGLGVVATRYLPKGTVLRKIKYGGEFICKAEFARLYPGCTSPYGMNYGSRPGYDIDAARRRSWASMINHSLRPNCTFDDHTGEVRITKDVPKGGQLFWNYNSGNTKGTALYSFKDKCKHRTKWGGDPPVFELEFCIGCRKQQ